MKLHDIVTGPWAISPEMFSEVQSIYSRHMRGEKIDLKALEAKMGASLPGSTRGYDVEGGVAVLPIDGVIAKRMNLMTQISGGTSSQLLSQDFMEALNDPSVSTIILNIDSPGGTVDGTQEVSNLIRAARGQKPIVALADGTMASAAYWIGSAADQIFVSSDTTAVGSIGVVASHTDVSGSEAKDGIKTTEISAGKYKRIASQYEPLSVEGRQSIQDQVDYTYSIFVNDVALNRGVSTDVVLENMADGRVFFGQQAISAGLADGVATLDDLIARAQAGEFSNYVNDPTTANHDAGALMAGDLPKPTTEKESDMDVTKLKAEFPQVAEALLAEGREAGAAAERQRIQDVEAQALPGHDALIASLKFDGKTSGGEAAIKVLQAEKGKKGNRLAALQADADASNVPHAAAPQPGDENDDEDEKDDENADDDNASASPTGGKGKKKAMAIGDARSVAMAAQDYQSQQAKQGIKISAAQAVAHVSTKFKEARHG